MGDGRALGSANGSYGACDYFAHQAIRFWDFPFLTSFGGFSNPRVLGANPNLLWQNLSLLGQNSSLLVQNSSLLGQNSSLQGQNPSLLGRNPSLLGQNPSLLGQDSDLYFLIREVAGSHFVEDATWSDVSSMRGFDHSYGRVASCGCTSILFQKNLALGLMARSEHASRIVLIVARSIM